MPTTTTRIAIINRSRISLILILILLALGALPAKADSFNFSFTPNQDLCVSYSNPCGYFGSGIFTTGPLTFSYLYNHVYPVTAIDGGSLNGSSMSIVVTHDSSGLAYFGAIPGPGTSIYYNNGPVNFIANGQEWALTRIDQGPWRDFLYNYTTDYGEPINLTITAPEPSMLLLLGIGIGLMTLLPLLRRYTIHTIHNGTFI